MKENLQFFSLPAGDYIIHYYLGMKIVKDSLIRPKRESLQRDPQVCGGREMEVWRASLGRPYFQTFWPSATLRGFH